MDQVDEPNLTEWFAFQDCEAWKKTERDEFARHELAGKAKAELAKVEPAKRVRVKLRMYLSEYDFKAQGFPFDLLKAGGGISITDGDRLLGSCASYRAHVEFKEDEPWPPLLPMAPEQAKGVAELLKKTSRSVVGEYVLDLLGVSGGKPTQFEVRPVALVFWTDQQPTKLIGMVGNIEPGAADGMAGK